jgi:hypothetical protein
MGGNGAGCQENGPRAARELVRGRSDFMTRGGRIGQVLSMET